MLFYVKEGDQCGKKTAGFTCREQNASLEWNGFVLFFDNKKSRSIDVPRLLCEIAGIKNA